MRVQISDDLGLGVIRDSNVQAPCSASELREQGLDALKALASDGHVFFIDAEDRINLPVQLLLNEPLPGDLADLFEPVGGTFLLRVPSGRVLVSGYEAWASPTPQPGSALAVPPGDYALVVHSREALDLGKYDRKMRALVGPAEWTFRNQVDKLWFVGCLPTLAALITLLVSRWRKFAFFLAGVAVIAWLPLVLLARSRRYRTAESRREAYERALPVYFLQLKPVEKAGSLVGGFIRQP